MTTLAATHVTLSVALWVVGGAVALAIAAALIGRALIKLGRRQPLVVRLINMTSDRVVDVVKRPITVAVLDEVADVLRAGHYTQSAAAALRENHDEITAMVVDKIKSDPRTKRIDLLPFHDRLVREMTETLFRVVLEVLADPRTDELFADLLRDNLDQLRAAVRARET